MTRVTDEMVLHWLAWARNFGEVVSWRVGSGAGRRFRIRVTPGITANGDPYRAKEGLLDLLGHEEKDVVPVELMLTAREALLFGMGCAAGRAAAMAGREHEWQRAREEAWTPAEREAFEQRRRAVRDADREEGERERAEHEAERLRRVEEYRRRREGVRQIEETS